MGKMVEQNMFIVDITWKKSDRDVLHDVFLLRSSFGTPKKNTAREAKMSCPDFYKNQPRDGSISRPT